MENDGFPWHFRRGIVTAHLLAAVAAGHGIARGVCLSGTGITPAQFDDPEAEITAEQEIRIVRNLLAVVGPDVPLGIEVGLHYQLTVFGVWGLAMLSARDMRTCVQWGLKHVALTTAFCRITVEERGDEVRLVFDDRAIPPDVRRFLVERGMVAALMLQRELTGGPIPLRSVHLRSSRPSYAESIETLCGRTITFDAPANVVCVDGSYLDLPNPRANELTARLCEKHCRALLEQRAAPVSLAERVHERIVRWPGEVPALDTVAAELGMTERTLRRRLELEATSYRALVNSAREAMAIDLLESGLTVADVAARLGYADTSSFTQAFRRWKGAPPSSHR